MPQKELIFTIIMPLKNKTKKEKKPTKIGLFLLSFNYCAFRIKLFKWLFGLFCYTALFPMEVQKEKISFKLTWFFNIIYFFLMADL